jgi:hypothetical protein
MINLDNRESVMVGGGDYATSGMSAEEYAERAEKRRLMLEQIRIDSNRIVPDIEGRDIGASALDNTVVLYDNID